jgi:hypothetical protein
MGFPLFSLDFEQSQISSIKLIPHFLDVIIIVMVLLTWEYKLRSLTPANHRQIAGPELKFKKCCDIPLPLICPPAPSRC